MQRMVDRLNETYKAYGMEISIKKIKVVIINNKNGKTEGDVTVCKL